MFIKIGDPLPITSIIKSGDEIDVDDKATKKSYKKVIKTVKEADGAISPKKESNENV